MAEITHATVAAGTDAGTGEIHKAEWNASHVGSPVPAEGLKTGTLTDDFDTTLSGWTAVSTSGSFVIGQCRSRQVTGSHLGIFFQTQNGYIYQSASNVDQTWEAGGIINALRTSNLFYGIALLDTSSNGVAAIYHTSDNTAAVISVTSGLFDNASAQTTSTAWGTFIGSPTQLWFKLTRTTNSWTMSVSMDGITYSQTTSSISKTITVARKCIGSFGPAAGGGGISQMFVDWCKTT